MRWNIGTKIGAGYALALLALVVVSVISYSSIERMIKTVEWVTHTNIVHDGILSLLSEMQDVETGQRGYMLTSDEKFLAPFNDAMGDVGKSIEQLKELTKDNPNQQQRLDNIRLLAEEKIASAKKGIEFVGTMHSEHPGEALEEHIQEFDYTRGKEIMDKFRVKIHEMQEEENNLLSQREAAAQGEVNNTKIIISVYWRVLAVNK